MKINRSISILGILSLCSGCAMITKTTQPDSHFTQTSYKASLNSSKAEFTILKEELEAAGINGQITTKVISDGYSHLDSEAMQLTSHNIKNKETELEVQVKKTSDSIDIKIIPIKIMYRPGKFENENTLYQGVIEAVAKLANYYSRSERKPSLLVSIIGMASQDRPRKGAVLGLLWGMDEYHFADTMENKVALSNCKSKRKVWRVFKSTDLMTNKALAMLRAIDLFKRINSNLAYEVRARTEFQLCYEVSEQRGAEQRYSKASFTIQ